MGDPLSEYEFEKHVVAIVASATQALPSQLNISIGEDVARRRRDPSIQAALKKCDDAVDQLRRMQIQLDQAAAKINRQTAAIRSSLAPVMSLPLEILSEIFSLVVHTHMWYDQDPVDVLCLAAVCTKWRYTALSTQNLWSLCSVTWPKAQQAAWLARSSTGPIDILVDRCEASPLLYPELRHQAIRWRSIKIHGRKPMVECFDTIMKLPDLRNLQTIDLSIHPLHASMEYDARDLQSTFSRMKSISITYINISNLYMVAENWTSLSLSRVAYPLMEWRKLLSSCQNLEILKLDWNKLLDSGSERPGSAVGTIVLPRLQDLTIHKDDGDIIFNHVSAPMLHSCRIDHSYARSGVCTSMRPFLQRHHTIVALTLGDFSWAQGVFDWLSRSPDMTIYNTLAPGYNQPLPNLKHLELLSATNHPILPSIVKSIISAREHLTMSSGLDAPPKVFVSLTTSNITYPKEVEDWINERVGEFIWRDPREDDE